MFIFLLWEKKKIVLKERFCHFKVCQNEKGKKFIKIHLLPLYTKLTIFWLIIYLWPF